VPVRRRPASLLAALAAAVLGVACSSSDGRELPAPDPSQTTTSVSAPVVAQPSEDDDVAAMFVLTSSAFAAGGVIPEVHTCTGADFSPPLAWSGVPAAAELALVVRDRDADGFVHWVVTGIDPTVQGLGAGGVPEGAVEAMNSAGTIGWFGPCPPAGSGTHTYDFALHALPEPLGLAAGAAADDAAAAVEGAASATATLTGTVTAGSS
jgi:Raf kinase inhibitor-like YbhB/YbcL family protein